jgi:hypothetical protein
MVHTIGLLVVLAGFAMLFLGSLSFLLAEFRESPLWGIAGLLLPVVNLVFLILFWKKAKDAFFLELWGFGTIMLGALAFHVHVPIIG